MTSDAKCRPLNAPSCSAATASPYEPRHTLSYRGPAQRLQQNHAVAVAEHTLFLMMAVARNGARFDRAVRAADFGIRSRLTAMELRGKSLLLVGYGRVGQEFARRARSLDMTILGFDPFLAPSRFPDVTFFPVLSDALAVADVVSLHVPLSEATSNLIDAEAMARMKPGAILLNAARGGIIDEAALVASLERGHLRGAGLDVFRREPLPPGDPLLTREEIIFSPHCAALTDECLVEMGKATVRNVLAAFDGTLDPNLVVNHSVLEKNVPQ
jgi:D-3-phosphoglycerate dehydrogenase